MITKQLQNHWTLLFPQYLQGISSKLKIEEMIEFYNGFSSQGFYDLYELDGVYYQAFFDKEKKEVLLGSAFFRDEIFLGKKEFLEALKKKALYLYDYEKGTSYYQLEDIVKGSSYCPDQKELASIHKPLLSYIKKYRPSLFERVSDLGLYWVGRYDVLRLYLLKFLAILPCLDHDTRGGEVKRIFIETLRRLRKENRKKKPSERIPWYLSGMFFFCEKIGALVPKKYLARGIRFGVKKLATRFIAGVDIKKAEKSLLELKKTGREATIDQLGELVTSDQEADIYQEKVMEIIRGLKHYYKKGERNKAGILKAHISIKVSALCAQFVPQDFDYTYRQIAPRLEAILKLAAQEEVFINVDAEHYYSRDMIFHIYEKCLKTLLPAQPNCESGIVLQAYLRDGAAHLKDILKMAKGLENPIVIRIVKGAYWDAETLEAQAHSYPPPQFLNKEETDLNFRQLALEILKNHKHLKLAFASHNILDHVWIRGVWERSFSQTPPVEHQCLHMTYEALSSSLALMGWPVRNYIPVGNLLVGMAYLVRRIMENSSQVGVLQVMRSHKEDHLLLPPEEGFLQKKQGGKMRTLEDIFPFSGDFINSSPARPYLPETLQSLKSHYKGKTPFQGSIGDTNPQEIKGKIQRMKKLEGSWFKASSQRREAVVSLSHLLLENRFKMARLITEEAGKSLLEALGDVDEAVDFLRFYLREEKALENLSPIGLIGVIAPWNFPLAIPVGMSMAAVIAGNAVLLKPAEQTPQIISYFHHLAREAKIPQEAFDIIWGGEVQGRALSDSDDIDGIIFTGSREVGEALFRKSFYHKKDRHGRPRLTIAEMGGKNPIVVTNNSELDETIAGCLYACFAHAGQKCSAASRILVHREVKESFLRRFIPAVKNLKVSSGMDFSSFINPVIGEGEKNLIFKRVLKLKETVEAVGGKVHLDLSRKYENEPSHLVGPVIVEIPQRAALENKAFFDTEFFAPIIHIVTYEEKEEVLKMISQSDYALTAGVFGQSQDDLDFFLEHLDGGNIYINRPNTGARVGIEPFGGYKMSGTGPKAGGGQYLKALKMGRYHFSELDLSREGFEEFQKTKFPNTFTPNQLSYTQWSKPVESIDYIIGEDLPNGEWKMLMELGRSLGSLVRFYIDPTVRKDWLAFFPDLKIEAQSAPDNFSELIIVSPSFDIQESCEDRGAFKKYLPRTYHLGHPQFKTREASELYGFFLKEQSFAINIMRHGAPLESFQELKEKRNSLRNE